MRIGIKKRIALICAMMLAVSVIVPMQASFASEKKPTIETFDTDIYRDYPGTHFSLEVINAIKGATYSAHVSDKSVAQLVNAGGEGSYAWFSFYAKKDGKVKVTVKQTLNGKKEVIGSETFTIKSKKFSPKKKKKEKLYKKVVKGGSDASGAGVSLEVLKVSNVKNSSKAITAKVKLRHKVTANEIKANRSKTFYVFMTDSKSYPLAFKGTLKKGSKTINVTCSKADTKKMWGKKMAKKLTKKGKAYYVRGLNTKANKAYKIKVKI